MVAFSGSQVNVPLAGGGTTNIIASLNVTCAASSQTEPFRVELPQGVDSPPATRSEA